MRFGSETDVGFLTIQMFDLSGGLRHKRPVELHYGPFVGKGTPLLNIQTSFRGAFKFV